MFFKKSLTFFKFLGGFFKKGLTFFIHPFFPLRVAKDKQSYTKNYKAHLNNDIFSKLCPQIC